MCTTRKNEKQRRNARRNSEDEVMTRGKMIYLFEDMKEFVRSTVKGSERVLRKEMHQLHGELKNDISRLETAATEHSKILKAHDKRFDAVDKRFDAVDKRFDAVDKKFDKVDTKIEDVRVELKNDMLQMEKRLTSKIKGHSETLVDHEDRISTLENNRP